MYYNKIRVILILVFCFIVTELSAEEGYRYDVVDESSPSFNEIEIPLLKNNKLSELIGDDRFKVKLYGGEFFVADDNVGLSKDNKEAGMAWANVAGGSFQFVMPDFLDISLNPQFIYIPAGNDQMKDFSANIDAIANLKLSDIITTGVALGYNYSKPLRGDTEAINTESISRYITPYIDIKATERVGVRLDTSLYDLTNKPPGYDNSFKAISFSVMPYWNYEEGGQLALKYTQGYKVFQDSAMGNVNWNEIMAIAKKQLTEKISGNIAVGFQSRRYDSGDDFNSVVGTLGLEYKPTDKVKINLSGTRTPYDSSAYSNFDTANNAVFNSQTDANFGVSNNTQRMTTNFNVANQVDLGVRYVPIVPLKLEAKLSAARIENGDPDYNLGRASISAVYSINEYVSVGVSYILRVQSQSSGYTDNMITTGIGFSF
jgi:hypothetical protein